MTNDDSKSKLESQVADLELTVKKLKQSEARLHAIIQSMSDGIAVADESGRLVMFNRAAEQLLGTDVTDSDEEEWADLYGLFQPDGVTPFPTEELPLSRALRGEYSHDIEMYVRNPNFEAPVLIRVRGAPVVDEQGGNHGGIATFRDITEERRMEQIALATTKELETQIEQRTAQLREKEQQTRLLLNSTAEAIYGIDLEGNCTFVNPSCVRLLGYESADEFVGRNMHDLIHHHREDGTLNPESECKIYQAFRLGLATHVDDEVFWRADGSCFPAEYWSHPVVRDEIIVGSVVTFLDTSERRLAEQEAQRHREELSHVVRLATMGEMATGLAHELNQPLAAIKNYSSGMLRRIRSKSFEMSSVTHVLEQVAKESMRAAGVIRSLRRFVTKSEPEPKEVEVNDLVESVAEMLIIVARRSGCEIVLELREELPSVIVEPIQIEQVLVNLINNGMEAMATTESEERQIRIRTDMQDSRLYITVQDRGSGFKMQEMDQLFHPFFTTKSAGLGMGLPISRKIIESYGGELWVTPNNGVGVTFHILLPQAGDGFEPRLDRP